MLKKLISHEWKDTWFAGTLCCIILAALTIIGVLVFSLDNWDTLLLESSPIYKWTQITIVMYFMLYGAALLATTIFIEYYFFYRYYKNLFTDQGYLMQTLPVKSSELICSKLIVASIWTYIIGFVIFLSYIGLALGFINTVDAWEEMAQMWQEICLGLQSAEFYSSIPLCIIIFIILLIGPIVATLFKYTAVGIGQTSKKNKFFLAVLLCVGMYILLQMIVQFTFFVPLTFVDNFEPTLLQMTIGAAIALILEIGIGIGLFFASKYFIDKNLNLE